MKNDCSCAWRLAPRASASICRVHASSCESRPRVPSFYVLDVVRAIDGRIPAYAELADRRSRWGSVAGLAGPPNARSRHRRVRARPVDAASRCCTQDRDRQTSTVAAAICRAQPALRRSVTERWARWQPRWHTADGLIRRPRRPLPALGRSAWRAAVFATALQRTRLSVSVSARGDLSPGAARRAGAVAATRSADARQPVSLDPGGVLSQAAEERPAAGHRGAAAARRQQLDWAIARVTEEAADELAPAIDRVWATRSRRSPATCCAGSRSCQTTADWVPERFEFAFGTAQTTHAIRVGRRAGRRRRPLPSARLDRSRRAQAAHGRRCASPITRRARTARRWPRWCDGGRVLQPMLYGLALEALTGEHVEEGRLSYCTTAGEFTSTPSRSMTSRGVAASKCWRSSIAPSSRAPLAAQPGRAAPARWCDFIAVCGPDEERRTAASPRALADLDALRRMP